MKTDKLNATRWRNPYKIFREGTLPIGLADAFQEKYGYDGLKACRICIWLEHLRGITGQWTLVTVAILLGSIFLTASPTGAIKSEAVSKIVQEWSIRCFISLDVLLLLAVFWTQKTYQINKKRMYDFRSKIDTFVCAFRSLLEREPQVIRGSTSKIDLWIEVSNEISKHAENILKGEIIGQEAVTDRHYLGQKSAAANEFGIGHEWSRYFEDARKRLGTWRNYWAYEIFAWEI